MYVAPGNSRIDQDHETLLALDQKESFDNRPPNIGGLASRRGSALSL